MVGRLCPRPSQPASQTASLPACLPACLPIGKHRTRVDLWATRRSPARFAARADRSATRAFVHRSLFLACSERRSTRRNERKKTALRLTREREKSGAIPSRAFWLGGCRREATCRLPMRRNPVLSSSSTFFFVSGTKLEHKITAFLAFIPFR